MRKKYNLFNILIRYLILLALVFSLTLVYKILTPLTIYPTIFLLKLFYQVTYFNSIIVLNSKTIIQIIPACIAGSAYLLLLILNLSIAMNIRKRIKTILFSIALLLSLNILRIFLLSILYHNSFTFFDITHKIFWYGLSTLFVILIWFYTVKKFKIKEIPIYTDLKYLLKKSRLS